jgi:hypothetical protein
MRVRHLLLASCVTLLPQRAHALSPVLDSIDDLPDALKSEYTEGADGKFHLQVTGMKPQADFDRLSTAHATEKRNHAELRNKVTTAFGDRPLEDVAKDLDRIPELEAAAEGKLDDDKINQIVEGRVKTRLAPVERERDQLKTQLGDKDKTIGELTTEKRQRRIDDAVREAAAKAKVTQEALDDALLLGRNVLEVREDDDKVVVREGTAFTQGIEPSVLFTDLQGKKPHWFPPSQGGGAGGNRGGGGGANNPFTAENWNMTEQGRLINADPDKANQLARTAGHADALTARRPAPAAK